MRKLPNLVKIGGVRHEVGHSILHGDLRYYLLHIPPTLLEIAENFNLHRRYLFDLLYLVSIAVKDYEVSRLLYRSGYLEDQVAYISELLTPSGEDEEAWMMARENRLAEALYLVSCLKVVGLSIPFLFDGKFGEEIKRRLTASLSHIPERHSEKILGNLIEGFRLLGEDTLDNIEEMTELVVREIVKPLLKENRNT